MALIVPYQTNGFARRAMIQRAMTSVGTRAAGRPTFAIADPHRTVQPVTRGFGDLCCNDCPPTVDYEAARLGLGALGATTTAGAIGGAKIGASVGSAIPVVGTAIGAILGGIGGAIASAFSRQDQEVQNFDQAQAISKANGPEAVVNIANKYLVLAGLFDLQPSQIKGNIPFYKQYGRMGEQKFVTDMMTLIYQAAQSGRITANDTPQSVYQNIVLPWMNSWGKGALQDSNGEMITWILIGMIAEYVSGLQTRWYARGGDYPFGSLPKFSLPAPPQAVLPPTQPPPAQQLPPAVNPATACAAPYVWNGSQCVLPASTPASAPNPVPTQTPASCVSPYVWNGTQCVLPAAAVPPSQNPGTAPSVPAGFQVVGTDANGNAIFSNPQGVLYSWTGSGMQIWSGQLATNSSAAAQMQAALQNALAQGQSSAQAAAAALQQAQSAGVANTPQLQDQVAQQVAATSAAPVQPIAAGIGTGTIGLLVGGGIILSLLLAKRQESKGRSRG
jgi:hypothetical protein